MKKKTVLFVVIILILIVIILYFSLFNNSGNISSLFIAEHVDDIEKIQITRNNDSVSLFKKEDQKWIVNKKYPASDKSIRKLYQALTEVKINKPVPKEKNDSVLNALHKNGTRITLYDRKDQIIRNWVIGIYEESAKGTYIKEKNYKYPCIVNIPGLENDLNERYNPNVLYWINPIIFSYEPHEITEIEIINHTETDQSFKLFINEESVKLILTKSNQEIKDVYKNKVGSYLSYFMNVKFSSFPGKQKEDSLKQQNPDYIVIIKDIYDIEKKVKLFRINKGNDKFDPFKLYALINNEDLVIVNYTDIDLIIKEPTYFTNL